VLVDVFSSLASTGNFFSPQAPLPAMAFNAEVDNTAAAARELAAQHPFMGPVLDEVLIEDVGKLIEKLLDQVQVYGQVSSAAELLKLKHRGASEEMLAGVTAASRELQALDDLGKTVGRGLTPLQQFEDRVSRIDKAFTSGTLSLEGYAGAADKLSKDFEKLSDDLANKLTAQSASPLENFKAQLADVDRLFGLGKISADTYARTVQRLTQTLDQAASLGQGGSSPLAGTAVEGSREAYSSIAAFKSGGGGNGADSGSGGSKIEDLLQRALAQQQQTQAAKDTAEAVKNLSVASF
jgi:hypothetical protein